MSTSEAPAPRRRFHLGDSLILIAALARTLSVVARLAVIVATLIFVDLGWVARIEVSWVAILAFALLLFWPVLGLPSWRSEASWIDRLGRAVGWGWIVFIASAMVLICL
ncbi:MAG: hypothetical protein ACLQIB_05885 [Isosphaeraceae bacterium]